MVERYCIMSLGVRKLIVVAAVVMIVLLANALALAHWLSEAGVVSWAASVRHEYLTGTAITVIVALLILATGPRRIAAGYADWIKRCPVCDRILVRRGRYCPACGSRV